MVDTLTSRLKLVDQETGNNDNTWGDILDSNLAILERAIAGAASISLAIADATLSDDENRSHALNLTGTITANRNVIVQNREKFFLVQNATSGAFTVTVKTAAGTGIVVPTGKVMLLYCDATNVLDFTPSLVIPSNSITSTELADGSVTVSKLGIAALRAAKMGWALDAGALGVIDLVGDAVLVYDLSDDAYKALALGKVGIGTQTVNLLAAGMIVRTTGGPGGYTVERGANKVMVSGYAFDASTEEAIQIAFPLPKGFDESKTLTFRFYWDTAAVAGTPGTDVIWGARAKFVRDGDVIDGAWGTAVEVTDTYLGTGQLMISNVSSGCTPAGTYGDNCMLWVEIYRKAAALLDTYGQDATLIAAMMTMQTKSNTDT